MADEEAARDIEPQHLKQVSNAHALAREYNLYIKQEDFGAQEVQEDLEEGPKHSFIIEHLEKKDTKKWNDTKRNTIHQQLQQYVELTRSESDRSHSMRPSNSNNNSTIHETEHNINPSITHSRSHRQSNADIIKP